MSTKDHRFWSDLVATANPRWNIAVSPQWGDESRPFNDLEVNVYLYDTSSRWKAACSTSITDMRSAKDTLEKSGALRNAIVDASTPHLVKAADANATANAEVTKQALLLAMAYLTDTRTFEVVQNATGGIGGHWLVVLYRLNDGTFLTRPAFVENRDGRALLAPKELEQWVMDVVQADTTNTNTLVFKTIANSKGAKLAVPFA